MSKKMEEKSENYARFKVRGWDEVLNKMCYDLDDLSLETLMRQGIKLMQCTGLVDAAGFLIYEGDLLVSCHDIDTYEVIREKSGRFIMVCKGKRACIVGYRVSIVGNIYRR